MLMPSILRPSRVLGLLICAVIGGFVGFLDWQLGLESADVRQLGAAQWVLAMGAFTAVVGWLTSSFVTVRNSVKQHTMSTLLQSRLSLAYVDRLKKVNETYAPIGTGLRPITVEELNGEASDPLSAARYMLNYFEFIAVGVRYGDLDEMLMKASLAGILNSLCRVGDEMIKVAVSRDPENFEHLRWLNARWQSKRVRTLEQVALVVLGAVVLVASGYSTHGLLETLTPTTAPLLQLGMA